MRISGASALFTGLAMNMAAQTIEPGALGGLSATDPNAFSSGESRRYMVGPTIEVRFFQGKLGIELDAIYRRVGDSYAGEFGPVPADYSGPPRVTRFYVRSRTNSWEFPLLGKYYFRELQTRWRPFIGTGYVIREQWRETTSTTYQSGETTARTSKTSASTGPDIGATAVAGVELRGLGRISFQPQVRYTRWGNYSSFGRPLNQVDIGLGLRF